jgi:ankyrin repeat protein
MIKSELSQVISESETYEPSSAHLSSYCKSQAQKSVDSLQLIHLNLQLIRAIHKADVYGENGVVKLISQGASIKTLDKQGESPIRIALSTKTASTIHYPLVKCLCENFADVSSSDIHGYTPFMTVVQSGCMKLVMLIYSYGTRNDLGQINKIKESALHIACHIRSYEVARFIVARMSKYGMQRQNINGLNAFHIACQNGCLKILQVLKKKGCDEEEENNKRTGLEKNMKGSNKPGKRQNPILYKKTLNRRDNRNWTCLHWAIFAGHVDVMRQLFKWGIQDLSEEETNRLSRLGEERASSYVASGKIMMAIGDERMQALNYLSKRRTMAEKKKLLFQPKNQAANPEENEIEKSGSSSISNTTNSGEEQEKTGVGYQRSNNGRRK